MSDPAESGLRTGRVDAALLSAFSTFSGRVAVDDHGDTLSYAELGRRALTLARTLRDRGVAPGATVAVHLERSTDLVVALVATMLAGAAHVAIDPADPVDRIDFMLADSRPAALVTTPARAERLTPGMEVIVVPKSPGQMLDVDPEGVPTGPEQPCYLVYTSGSTGRPKASLIPHRALASRLRYLQRLCPLQDDDRVLYNTASGFDVSVAELYWPLVAGATLVISRTGGQRDADYLADILRDKGITTLHFVPSLLDLFLTARDGEERYDNVRRVLAGGEALSPALVKRWHARSTGTMYNMYGPSECAVYTTAWRCPRDPDPEVVLIGSALDDTDLYVLDADLQPVLPGTPGELFIGGVGLALGYHDRPQMNEEKFLRLPVSQGVLYRSGDLVREVENGEYQYLGRLDRQVKIRGFRVELAEIEAVAATVPGVRRAAVVSTLEPMRLVAALEPREAGAGTDTLIGAVRQAVADKLPAHMVPTVIFPVEAIPLTPNGKLDTNAVLRQAEPLLQRGEAVDEPAQGPVESAIAAIWCEVLGVENVGREDDLFEIGGNSLSAVRIMKAVRSHFSVTLPMRVIFASRTVRGLAHAVSEAATEAARVTADGG